MALVAAIEVRQLEKNPVDIAQSLEVLRGGLGEGYITYKDFVKFLRVAPQGHFKAAFIAKDRETNKVVGVLTTQLLTPTGVRESFLDSYPLVRKTPEVGVLRRSSTGIVKSIAVDPDYQRQGIAARLIQMGMDALNEHGAEALYSLAWESKERGCHLCGVLTNMGFTFVAKLDRFWYNDSIEYGYSCPSCGNPCQCSVQLFVK